MKISRLVIIIMFCLLLTFGFLLWNAEAQMSRKQDYLTNSLQTSLMGLRSKAQKITERNNWLWAEIQVLKQQTAHYENQETPSFPKSSLDHKIGQTSKEIARLRSRIDGMQAGRPVVDSAAYPLDKQQLLARTNQMQIQIGQSENYLEQLQKKHGRRSKVYGSLLQKQVLLKQKFTLLENELNLAIREYEDLNQSLVSLDENRKNEFEATNQNVIQLRNNVELLEKTLSRAHKKVENKNIDFDITDEEIENLMENLAVITNQRNMLKSDYTRLNKDFQAFQDGGWPFAK